MTVTGTRLSPGAKRTVGAHPTRVWVKGNESTLPLSPTASHPLSAQVSTVIGLAVVFVNMTVPLIG